VGLNGVCKQSPSSKEDSPFDPRLARAPKHDRYLKREEECGDWKRVSQTKIITQVSVCIFEGARERACDLIA